MDRKTCVESSVLTITYDNVKGRNPHRRTSWKLVGNPGCELVANCVGCGLK